jgi:hypothetical protein
LSCYQMLFNLGLNSENLRQLRSQIYSYWDLKLAKICGS